ncbi:arabinofuranosyltransferase [Nocardia ninae]
MKLTRVLGWIGLSGFVAVTIGMPLAASRLYLSGLSPDQQWRSELLTRFADSPAWQDGTYVGLPPDQSAGWYWLGGRVAVVAGVPGWEALKPYAIASIAAAAVLALVWWSRMLRTDIAIVLASVTTAVAVAYAAPDPAFTICLLLLVPALFAAWTGLRGPAGQSATAGITRRATSAAEVWARLVGVVAYLGLCAAFNKASFVIATGAVTFVALLALTVSTNRVAAIEGWPKWQSVLGRWLFMTSSAVILAALAWSTYLRLRGIEALSETEVYADEWGATGRVFIAAIGVFTAATMIRAISTILRRPAQFHRVTAAVAVIGVLGFSQHVPDVLGVPIGAAYTDTDGDGVRADGYPVSSVAEYERVDAAIIDMTRRTRRDSVVLTGDTTLLAIYPYRGFLAQSARYSNPLSSYDSRVQQIRNWAALSTPSELVGELDRSPRPAPTVFVLRRSGSDYLLRLASDPLHDNGGTRTYTTISFPGALFDGAEFTRTEVGPFTVLVHR